ncbi:hypothetical protein TNCV_1957361 [Trichonephila clavipes]|nr:hypothetical protein TNCV_1957361 [Trichonephila clavipes]
MSTANVEEKLVSAGEKNPPALREGSASEVTLTSGGESLFRSRDEKALDKTGQSKTSAFSKVKREVALVDNGSSACSRPYCCVWEENFQANNPQMSINDYTRRPVMCPFDYIQQKRPVGYCGAENTSWTSHEWGRAVFSDVSRFARKVIFVESLSEEKVELAFLLLRNRDRQV